VHTRLIGLQVFPSAETFFGGQRMRAGRHASLAGSARSMRAASWQFPLCICYGRLEETARKPDGRACESHSVWCRPLPAAPRSHFAVMADDDWISEEQAQGGAAEGKATSRG
jgi:hypothetical protein